MAEALTLIGYHPSVYTRVVRMALSEMGLQANYIEANPFAATPDPILASYTPFDRVPVLRHGDFTLTETAAILRYLDQISDRASLIPPSAHAAARMAQVIGVVDAYGYVPIVRDVASHGFYRASVGAPSDPERVVTGLWVARPVLTLLNQIAQEGEVLNGKNLTLADLHLAPMMAFFVKVPEAARTLGEFNALNTWWASMLNRASLVATDPLSQS